MASNAEPIADLSSRRFPIGSRNTPPVLDVSDPSTASCSPIQQEALNPGTNTSADVDFFLSHLSGPVQPHFKPTEYPLIKEPPEPPLYEDGPEDLLDLCKDPVENLGHDVTAALTATPSSDLSTQVESYRDEQEVLRGFAACNTRRQLAELGERKLRFTRDSECGIQARNVAYLYPYKLG
jgi:hypothetical protein